MSGSEIRMAGLLACQCTFVGGTRQSGEFRQNAPRIARGRLGPCGAPARQFNVVDMQLQEQLAGINRYDVALFDKCYRAPQVGFRRDVADDHSPCAA